VGENLAAEGEPIGTVFIDAGTGFSAAALLYGLGFLKLKVDVKVVWLGDAQGNFQEVLQRWRPAAEALFGGTFELPRWDLVRPPTARSFGAVNRRILKEVAQVAREEGFLVDPIYTAKLTLTARAGAGGQGSRLLFCGGGALELSGFQEGLARLF
jgi:1-aminocyclopropane-1-carboxylate deaminase/D-cysteine desulfhydrase